MHFHGNAAFWGWPVDERQVQVVGTQLVQAVHQAGQQLVGRHVLHPDLGGKKQLVTGDAGGGNGLSYFCFIVIDLGGVDGAVAQFQGGADRIDKLLALQAERAKAEGGNLAHGVYPVVNKWCDWPGCCPA
jgi:hypothetical protein